MIVKLARIVLIVLSAFSMLSTGCAKGPAHKPSSAADDSSALTEDEPSVRTEDRSSPSGYPPIARDLKRLTWELGPEVYYYKYKEENFMELEGMYYGVNLNVTARNWLPTSPDQSWEALNLTTFKLMVRGEARFALGEVDYSGAWSDGTPLHIGSIDDRVFEARILVGPDFPMENTMFTLFTGLGYRYLHNNTRQQAVPPPGYGYYERESQYLYLPLGAEMTTQLSDGWSWGLSGELDIFLWGNQRSHIPFLWYYYIEIEDELYIIYEDEEFSDNYQPRGYGLRLSARLQKKGKKIDFIIEPFIRYWKINESDLDFWWQGLEPTNSTLEAGVRIMLGF